MSDEKPNLFPVEFIGWGGTHGNLTLDGVDISRFVSAVSFEAKASDHVRLVIELTALAQFHLTDPSTAVDVGQDTAELLKRLGWTPPEQ